MFRYLADPLFLVCCGLYGLNRWVLKPHLESVFLRSWFNDLLLVPCAVPVVFWLFRRMDLRQADDPPKLIELCWILVVWSMLFEWIGPRFVEHATADWRDVVMYWTGGLLAWGFWRARLRRDFVDEL
jgi:hypothetical protein